MKLDNTVILALFLVGVSQQAFALEVTKELCANTLADFGVSTETYEFDDGWLTDKHVFDNTIECYERRENVYIVSDGKVIAEDGYFGVAALEARDVAISSHAQEVKQLKAEKDKLVDDILREHKDTLAKREVLRDQQLLEVREGNIPSSILAIANAAKEKIEVEKAQQKRDDEISAKAKAEKKTADDAALTEKLLKELKTIPAADFAENLSRYEKLVLLHPENKKYQEKAAKYLVAAQAAGKKKAYTIKKVKSKPIKVELKAFAKKEYPDDPSMQMYVFKKQLAAYNYMDAAQDTEVASIAKKSYPEDYAMQKYVYDKQAASKQYMKSVKDPVIKRHSISEHPNDYAMQKYVYDKQLAAKAFMSE